MALPSFCAREFTRVVFYLSFSRLFVYELFLELTKVIKALLTLLEVLLKYPATNGCSKF